MSDENTKWMKVRIESNGNPHDTKVFNAETGEVIQGVRSIEWVCDAQQSRASTIIKVASIPSEMTGEAQIVYVDLVNEIANFVKSRVQSAVDENIEGLGDYKLFPNMLANAIRGQFTR